VNAPAEKENPAAYTERIIDEVCYALGVGRSGVRRKLLGPLLRLPARRFGRLAARADSATRDSGITGGSRRILPDINMTVSARRKELIPADGPLLVVSNHPGGLDSIAILSCLPRKDTSVLISDVPFTRAFVVAREHFIYVPLRTGGRGPALRAAIDHLRKGGSLLLFPHGDVEPDPELGPGASGGLQKWSRSIEIMLREVPACRLQAAIASGALLPRFARSPLVKIRKTPVRRQKLAEVIQLCQQVVFPRSVRTQVHISFARPVLASDLVRGEAMPAVIRIARVLLEDHLAALSAARRGGGF
jgi:1-acyl-sn-glycerol-3-phosphate acyltransferase